MKGAEFERAVRTALFMGRHISFGHWPEDPSTDGTLAAALRVQATHPDELAVIKEEVRDDNGTWYDYIVLRRGLVARGDVEVRCRGGRVTEHRVNRTDRKEHRTWTI
jgi:hypothetical protein